MDGALTFVSEGDRKTGRPATYPLLWPRPDKPAARFYTVSGRVEDTARGEGVGSFVRNWSLSMRLLSVAPYLSEAWPMLRPFTPPGNTCNLANSKGFSYSIAFLFHRFDAVPSKKGTMIAFVSKGSGEYLEDKGIFSDIESSIKLNEATKEDTINIGDEDRGWDTGLLAKLLLIFMQIYGFEGGEGRSRRKVLEGERSGRIVRRGARSLLNLPNTASPIPRLPFLLSSSREKLGGFVLRRKTSSFQPARMSFTTCLRTVHIPRPFCGSSTICDVTRHNFDRWFFPFSPRINPFLSSFQVLRHGYYFRDYCTKENE